MSLTINVEILKKDQVCLENIYKRDRKNEILVAMKKPQGPIGSINKTSIISGLPLGQPLPRWIAQLGCVKNNMLTFYDEFPTYEYLIDRIRFAVPSAINGSEKKDLIRILQKYVAPCVVDDSRGRKPSKAIADMVKRNTLIKSWIDFVALINYELTSEGGNLKEIDLAEIVCKSQIVRESMQFAIREIANCIESQLSIANIVAGSGASMNMKAALASLEHTQHLETRWEDLEKKYHSSSFGADKKLYHPFTNGMEGSFQKLSSQLVNEKNGDFEKLAALLHDLLQIVFDFYNHPSLPNHPLCKPMRTQVLTEYFFLEMKDRSVEVDAESRRYARSMGRPSEVGPSYTTVRVAMINDALEKLRTIDENIEKESRAMISHGIASAQEKQALENTLRKLTQGEKLSDDQRKYIVWGMFAFWALYYQKSVTLAHTFFEVSEAADQCGIKLGPATYVYPELTVVAADLGVSLSLPDESTAYRKRAFKSGLTIAAVSDSIKKDDYSSIRRELKRPI